MMTQNYIVKPLKDCRENIPILAKLWFEEISQHWVPDTSIEKAEQKLIAHLNSDKLPMAFVALDGDQPIGMACLRENDGILESTCPWLGSLVVHPNYRNCKVGEMLINAVKQEARKLSYQILYLLAFDPTIPQWYAKLGWKHIGYDELFEHRVTVMCINI